MPASPPAPNLRNAYIFLVFNAIAFQMALSSPIVLFARDLGASSFAIGILTGVLPMMMGLQLPFARYAERVGYRTIHVYAYFARTSGIICFALLAWFAANQMITTTMATVLLMITMTILSIFRGIASGTWLPWIAMIVPRENRLDFLSNERICNTGAAVGAMLLASALLSVRNNLANYAIVFAIGGLTCGISTYFLAKMPQPRLSSERLNAPPLALRNVLADADFRRFLTFNIAVQLVVGAMPAFVTVFLREVLAIESSWILIATAGALLAGVIVIQRVRYQFDKHGSLYYLRLVLRWWFGSLLAWLCLSVLPFGPGAWWIGLFATVMSLILMVITGGFGSLFDLSISRLVMNQIGDREGSPMFFAMHGMLANLAAAFSPMAWGALIDGTRGAHVTVSGITVTHFTYFFVGQWVLLIVVWWGLRRLREPISDN